MSVALFVIGCVWAAIALVLCLFVGEFLIGIIAAALYVLMSWIVAMIVHALSECVENTEATIYRLNKIITALEEKETKN